jgi:nitrite reductase (NADH) large subunit
VVVNDTMQTYDPRGLRGGRVRAASRRQCYGLVAPLFEQAKVCANHLAARHRRYEGSVTSTKLKVTGIEMFSAGDFLGDEHSEDLVFQDAGRGVYKKLVLRDNRIRGAVLYGDTLDGAWYFQLMREGTDGGRHPRHAAVRAGAPGRLRPRRREDPRSR